MNFKTIKKAAALALTFSLIACASAGNMQIKDMSQESVSSQIVKGVTTKADLRKAYGPPSAVGFTDSGNEVWNYVHSFAKPKPVNFVPVVSSFVRGADVDTKQLAIIFDKHGIVKNYTFNQATSEAYSGIAAGIAAPKSTSSSSQQE